MPIAIHNLQDAHALVIEGNLQSRSILVSQLRELGVGTVSQCSRLVEARRKLEVNRYDVVICEQHFDRDSMSGQDLLDDLRRNQLLPFYTVFIMVTAEASYAKVAEAAESALDAYLLKPHTGARLSDRIMLARERKKALEAIFTAIDAEQFDHAAALCLERFEARQPYWLYAARIGAELLLRNGEIGDAQKLYEAVIAAKTLPWARLGVARAQLEGGQPAKAVTTLESLIRDDDTYADAYDVMGRAQFELGNFQSALTTYQMATKLTPSSISRLLKHGMLAYYTGEKSEGVELLDRATRLGLDSKMFDAQALLLLAFARLDNNDQRGLARTVDQLTRLRDRSHAPARPHRLLGMAESLLALQQQHTSRALDDVRRLTNDALSPDFDFETACNLLALMCRLQMRSIALNEAEGAVDTLALRFCTSKAMSELMACACAGSQGFADRVRGAHSQILKMTEQAMTLSIKGDPQGTVMKLLEDGERTLNAKLIESAHQVLQRYTVRIAEYTALSERTDALRERYHTTAQHSRLGEHTGAAATPGGVSLPAGYKAPSSEGLLSSKPTA
ncbi:response regulator [Hydrogenophaga sp.]|uniref:response regulator n=1 Tax=Hydrogenophaga sp. TaxID=1904254 RepID=UPI00272FCF82|nr:response regulator [Hydrogenophaga sp.]MDP2016847.1 response regulator [Hydrogenophaga sp.]MDP3167398.1 response regulator [Hydrogenophaga sp.]MDP3810696.1 response regulator [Hydrogenophaga sp.]